MNAKYVLLLFLAVVFAGSATAQLDVQTNFTTSPVQPGAETSIGHVTLTTDGNSSAQLTNIVTNQLPFDLSYGQTAATVNNSVQIPVNATVPSGFSPGPYPGQIIFVFDNQSDIRKPVTVTVAENKNWSIQQSQFKSNVSVGDDGQLGAITVQNTGNVKVDFQVGAEGNITDYLVLDDRTTSYPGLEEQVRTGYQVPRTTDFGTYTGNITLTTGNETRKVPVAVEFLDEIDPELQSKSFLSFQATQAPEFTVTASDNLDVGTVSAKILYEVEKQQGNETIIVNETLETLEFSQQNHSNKWTATLENGGRIGHYYVDGTIQDEAGNTVNFTDSFNVTALDVVRTKKSPELPVYKYGTELEHNVGYIEEDTPLKVKLESFSQPLDGGDSNWDVGLVTPSGKQYFEEEGDTIELDQTALLNPQRA